MLSLLSAYTIVLYNFMSKEHGNTRYGVNNKKTCLSKKITRGGVNNRSVGLLNRLVL
jgi:hypothetical protein